jgi:hypothetical protein
MTRSATDSMIRICYPCAITWKGSAPCWVCGCDGTRGGDALAAHYATSSAWHYEPVETPAAGVRRPPVAVPTMHYDPQMGDGWQ